MFYRIVEVCIIMLVLNVWLERGVSVLRRVKIKLWSWMKNDVFEVLMYVLINGFVVFFREES